MGRARKQGLALRREPARRLVRARALWCFGPKLVSCLGRRPGSRAAGAFQAEVVAHGLRRLEQTRRTRSRWRASAARLGQVGSDREPSTWKEPLRPTLSGFASICDGVLRRLQRKLQEWIRGWDQFPSGIWRSRQRMRRKRPRMRRASRWVGESRRKSRRRS